MASSAAMPGVFGPPPRSFRDSPSLHTTAPLPWGSLKGGFPCEVSACDPLPEQLGSFTQTQGDPGHLCPQDLRQIRVGEGDRAFPVAGPSAEVLAPEPSKLCLVPSSKPTQVRPTPVVTGARWGFPARWGGREAARAFGCRLERTHVPVPQVSG